MDTKVGKILTELDGQIEKRQHLGVDSNYVGVPELNRQVYISPEGYWQRYDIHVPLTYDDELAELLSEIDYDVNDYEYYKVLMHTKKADFGIGINYKGFNIEIPIPLLHDKTRTYSIAKNGAKWGFRMRYRDMKSFDGAQHFGLFDLISDLYEQPRSSYLDPESNNVKTFFVEGYYVFNHRKFSLPAALRSSMIQKRSAGSFIIMANYYQSRYRSNELFLGDYDVFRTNQVSLGGGYGYNWSFNGGRLLFHLSSIPMISLYQHATHKYVIKKVDPDDPILPEDFDYANLVLGKINGTPTFRINGFSRLAMTYNIDRHYIVRFHANYRHNIYSNRKKFKIANQDADVILNVGYRF